MTMKKTRLFAAGLTALAMAGGANAAIEAGGGTSPNPTGNPEMFLAVWDNSGTTPTTVVVDLGLHIDSTDWNTDFSTTVNLSGLGSISTLSYAVLTGGYDGALDGTLYYTAASPFSGNIFQGGSGFTEMLGNIGRIGNFVLAPEHNVGTLAENNTTTAVGGPGIIPGGLAFNGSLIDNTTSNLFIGTQVGQSMAFFSSIVSGTTGLVDTTQLGAGRMWSLIGNQLRWEAGGSAPIPLPAGVWLLGSALLGLVGVARRRNQQLA